jgi:hypothetical protein
MPERSWLSWVKGLRLPPSPNETPRTRKKRLLEVERNRLWPSEEANWLAAQENKRREEREEAEARVAAEFNAIEQKKAERIARRLMFEERKAQANRNKEEAIRRGYIQPNNASIRRLIAQTAEVIKNMNASAKRRANARKPQGQTSATRKSPRRR